MPKIIVLTILLSILLVPFPIQAQEQEEKPSAWQNIYGWIKEKAMFVYDKIYYALSQEVEQRRPSVEDEFKKETEEMTQEIKEKAPSWWQRLKNLIK